jgi:ABC-type transporter MlaC component
MPRKNRPIAAAAAALVLTPLALPASAAEAEGAVTAFVARINAVVGPVKPGDRAAIRAACATLVEQAFDIDAMAPAITEEAWTRMNGKLRAAYVRGLSDRAASDCAAHGSEIAGNTVELVGVREGESGDRLVAVRQSKGRNRTVIWRVRRGPGGTLKAVDMTVDGNSLAASARRDAKNVLKKTGGDLTALVRSVGS